MDDIEKQIADAILQILLEARRQNKDVLSFEEVLEMLGMDDNSLMTEFEKNSVLSLNTKLLDKLLDVDNPELLEAMVESLGETKH
jgi:hypothetical protein